mgnify:CR=1 FL=1
MKLFRIATLTVLMASLFFLFAAWSGDVKSVYEWEQNGNDSVSAYHLTTQFTVTPIYNTTPVKYGTYSWTNTGANAWFKFNTGLHTALNGNFTIQYWIQFHLTSGNNSGDIVKAASAGSPGNYGLGLVPLPGNGGQALYVVWYFGNTRWDSNLNTYADTNWHLVSFEYNDAAAEGRVYVDGNLIHTFGSLPFSPFDDSSGTDGNLARIGRDNTQGIFMYDKMDRMVISENLYTGAEIIDITKTITPSVTQTVTPTVTQTVTPTVTQTVTQTITKTITQTVTQTVTPTITQTITATTMVIDLDEDCQCQGSQATIKVFLKHARKWKVLKI